MKKGGFDQDNWFRDYLSADEYVQWTGSPDKRLSFQPVYLFLIPFMTIWCGAVIVSTVQLSLSVKNGEENAASLLFMIPFWLGGLLFIYMLFILPVIRRKNTRYAVTNKRVIEFYRGNINSISINPQTPVSMSAVNRRGKASITVGTPCGGYGYTGGFSVKTPWHNNGTVELIDVDEPQKVYNLILNADAPSAWEM